MTRLVNRAENWEVVYQAFKAINFTAYTYDSLKQSLIDYIRQYHSELFNDFIESSELIATIETFAYFCEMLAYRYDMNAHENALTTAQRKESVLRLARYLSYNASRNIPARGLLKITSITSSEDVYDSTGINLANVAVRWNDPVTTNWRERFYLVINRALAREYGNVTPSDRVQISDVLFEQYHLNVINNPTTLPYSVSFGGETYDMEIVSSILTSNGPEERRPTKGMPFALMFADDGNGDDSAMTGFFCMTKQGSMQRREIKFDGVTPNYSVRVDANGINNTDVWLNRIDSQGNVFKDETGTTVGEWNQVDTSTAYSVIFNTLDQKLLYEVETRDNDQAKLIFGDGEFADIPSGTFELWYRVSEFERDIIIPKSAIADQNFVFTYADSAGQMQSLRITVSASASIQNAASSESIERIRRVAPATYYAQDRMVNGKDYNTFPLKDNSIFKLRTLNRTFAGDSKYIPWHDPTGSYENVKMFGNDLALYYETEYSTQFAPDTITPEGLVAQYLTPLLRTSDIMTRFVYEKGGVPGALKSAYTGPQQAVLIKALREIKGSTPETMYATLTGTAIAPVWTFSTTRPNDAQEGITVWWYRVTTRTTGGWDITHITKKIVARSQSTRFWNTNTTQNIAYDAYRPVRDQVTILKSNIKANTVDILDEQIEMNVESAYLTANGPERGLPDVNAVLVSPADSTRDGIPDNLNIRPLFRLPDILGDTDFVYFKKDDQGTWQFIESTIANIRSYYEQFGWSYPASAPPAPSSALTSITGRKVVWKYGAAPDATIKREVGRTGLNFLWTHYTPRYHLIDPAPSNIMDMFVMTRGYQQAYDLWLSGRLPLKPQPPSPVELRISYKPLLDNKMISDAVIFQPGKIKTIINSKSDPQLRAKLKVIKGSESLLTNSEIKVRMIEACREFFDLNKWEFGAKFYFTELAAVIHNRLGSDISSVVIVPESGDSSFGDGFQILAREDEIIYGFVSPNDIEIVTSLDRPTLKQTTNA